MNENLMKTDQEQRALALDPSQSFIVQAPAGSGKTELLIQRFLTLLNNVKTPEEILAITFTKKAANEMRARIIKALKFADTEPEPKTPHAKLTWHLAKNALKRDHQLQWNLLSNPNQLRIQTIDSLCTYLTCQLPLLSHFGSQPTIADSPLALYKQAVQEVLMHVEENYEWSKAIAHLLTHLDNNLNKLHDLMINLLAKRDQWRAYIHLDTTDAEIRKQLEYQLSLVISDSLRSLQAVFPKPLVTELTTLADFAASNLEKTNPDSDIICCKGMTALPGIQAKDKIRWLALAKLLLTTDGSWRKSFDARIGFPAPSNTKNSDEKMLYSGIKTRMTALISSLHEQESLRLQLLELAYLPEPTYLDDQWDILKSLLHVLKIVAAQLRVTFQQHGQIDFIENAQAALSALGNEDNPTDLALALDYQIKHILVDEFQDTALTQYQLLEKLIAGWQQDDGRSLFVVGDPMQSIYRFRQAEVGLFIRMCTQGIGQVMLTPLTLSVNFRSTPQVVDWINAHFQAIFPSYNDIATGAVVYSQSAAHTNVVQDHQSHSLVQVHGYEESNRETQANDIITLIQELKTSHSNDSIAILVKSRTHLASIIPALKRAKLSYRALDIDPLASRQIIQDLLALTCALLHPADRISWLAILRAPWCGLTLEDLLIIAGNDAEAAIWDLLNQETIIKRLSVYATRRLQKFMVVMQAKIAERERYDLRYWIESTWLLLGGPAFLEDYADIDDAHAFFQLLEELNQSDLSLNQEKLKDKISRLYASTNGDDATIQIMTIHAAKGLEFDTVILPHLERKSPKDDKSLMLWMDRPLSNDQTALLLAPIHATGQENEAIYQYIAHQQDIKLHYETDRLLYVAATRAKKRLHLYFNIGKNDKGEFRVESGSFLSKLWPVIKNMAPQFITTSHLRHSDASLEAPTERHIIRAQTAWVNPINDIMTTKIATHIQPGGFILQDNKPKLLGIVIHKILQLISELGVTWWLNANTQQQNQYLQHHLSEIGILPNDLNASMLLASKTIKTVLSDTRGLWIMQAHTHAKSEFSITALIEGKAESLIIDRTFIDETGIRWIIDYKTATLENFDLETFLAHEQEKYLEKMRVYYQAMRLIEDRPIRLGLYFPALPAWREWEF